MAPVTQNQHQPSVSEYNLIGYYKAEIENLKADIQSLKEYVESMRRTYDLKLEERDRFIHGLQEKLAVYELNGIGQMGQTIQGQAVGPSTLGGGIRNIVQRGSIQGIGMGNINHGINGMMSEISQENSGSDSAGNQSLNQHNLSTNLGQPQSSNDSGAQDQTQTQSTSDSSPNTISPLTNMQNMGMLQKAYTQRPPFRQPLGLVNQVKPSDDSGQFVPQFQQNQPSGSSMVANMFPQSQYNNQQRSEEPPKKKRQRNVNSEKKFKCQKCDKEFVLKSSLNSHVANIHSGIRPFQCTYCPKTCTTKQLWTNHINGNHLNKKPFVCDYCQKGFVLKQNMEAHRDRIHLYKRPYKCESCSKDFFSKYDYKKHRCS